MLGVKLASSLNHASIIRLPPDILYLAPSAAKHSTLEIIDGDSRFVTEQRIARLQHDPQQQPSELDRTATSSPLPIDVEATHLIGSPYPDFTNQLDLRTLATPLQLLAHAMTLLEPVRPDYAVAPYMTSLNWPIVFARLRHLCAQIGLCWERREMYVVIFRSRLKEDANRTRLGQLDQESHREACESGGLLKYWFGSCNAERQNLATCKSAYAKVL